MAGWLDSKWVLVLGYVLAAAAAGWAGLRERRRRAAEPDLRPCFWFLTAVLLAAMGVARVERVTELVGSAGRRLAYEQGWYDGRRPYQEIGAVSLIGAAVVVVMVVVVVLAVSRRSRGWHYLPACAVMLALAAFAAVRTLSLHEVDATLHDRRYAGIALGPMLELSLLALLLATTFWPPGARRAGPSAPSAVHAGQRA